jgi:drug/metabolite transporter (DMT)-like permease
LFIGILLSAFGGIFLKLGSVEIVYDGIWKTLQNALFNWKILLGVALYIVPSFIWVFMLKKVDISYLQPMFSLVYVATPVLAFLIIHENIPFNRVLGTLIIIIGVIVVARA